MRNVRRTIWVVMGIIQCMCRIAYATPQVLNVEVSYDNATGLLTFETTYDQVPDLITMDEFERYKDGLAWDFGWTPHPLRAANTERVIRRNNFTPDDTDFELIDTTNWAHEIDPEGPRWSFMEEVPFTLVDRTIAFSIYRSLLLPEEHTHLYYDAWTANYGRTYDSLTGFFVIPEPTTLLLLGLGGLMLRRKR